MPLRCNVDMLLAQHNVERVTRRERALSVRGLAQLTGVAHSSLVNLIHNRTTRFDLDTLHKLMAFFKTKDIGDIFIWSDE